MQKLLEHETADWSLVWRAKGVCEMKMHHVIYAASIALLSLPPLDAVAATLKYVGKNYTHLDYSVGNDCTESIRICYNERGPYERAMNLEFNVELDGDLQANTSYDLVTSGLSDGIHYSDGDKLIADYPDSSLQVGGIDGDIEFITNRRGKITDWMLYFYDASADPIEMYSTGGKYRLGNILGTPYNSGDYVQYVWEYQWCMPGGDPDCTDFGIDPENSSALSVRPGTWYLVNEDGSETRISPVPSPAAAWLLSTAFFGLAACRLRRRASWQAPDAALASGRAD